MTLTFKVGDIVFFCHKIDHPFLIVDFVYKDRAKLDRVNVNDPRLRVKLRGTWCKLQDVLFFGEDGFFYHAEPKDVATII